MGERGVPAFEEGASKWIILGGIAVGKSSIGLRFVRGQFFQYQESTIGAAFLKKRVHFESVTVSASIL